MGSVQVALDRDVIMVWVEIRCDPTRVCSVLFSFCWGYRGEHGEEMVGFGEAPGMACYSAKVGHVGYLGFLTLSKFDGNF